MSDFFLFIVKTLAGRRYTDFKNFASPCPHAVAEALA